MCSNYYIPTHKDSAKSIKVSGYLTLRHYLSISSAGFLFLVLSKCLFINFISLSQVLSCLLIYHLTPRNLNLSIFLQLLLHLLHTSILLMLLLSSNLLMLLGKNSLILLLLSNINLMLLVSSILLLLLLSSSLLLLMLEGRLLLLLLEGCLL